MTEDGKDHGQPPERSNLRDRTCAASKKTDQEHGDLALETKEDGVGRLAPNEMTHCLGVFLVRRSVEVDHAGDIPAQHPVLEKENGRADGNRHPGIQKNENERE